MTIRILQGSRMGQRMAILGEEGFTEGTVPIETILNDYEAGFAERVVSIEDIFAESEVQHIARLAESHVGQIAVTRQNVAEVENVIQSLASAALADDAFWLTFNTYSDITSFDDAVTAMPVEFGEVGVLSDWLRTIANVMYSRGVTPALVAQLPDPAHEYLSIFMRTYVDGWYAEASMSGPKMGEPSALVALLANPVFLWVIIFILLLLVAVGIYFGIRGARDIDEIAGEILGHGDSALGKLRTLMKEHPELADDLGPVIEEILAIRALAEKLRSSWLGRFFGSIWREGKPFIVAGVLGLTGWYAWTWRRNRDDTKAITGP